MQRFWSGCSDAQYGLNLHVSQEFEDTFSLAVTRMNVFTYFSGQTKMLADPVVHEIQYPDLFPLPDIQELEKVEARESIRR